MSENPGIGEPGRVRKGWKRLPSGKWEPVIDPKDPSPRTTVRVSLKNLDESLEASHRRMQRALAAETARLEAAATKGALSGEDIEVLGRLSTTWRTLVQNEPTQDYSELTDEQIRAKLAEVKR
jgi:hypothetical protein